MSDAIRQAQSQISGHDVARMQLDFLREFRHIYGKETLMYVAHGVGPMHSFLGYLIGRGYLKQPDVKPPELYRTLTWRERLTGKTRY